MNALKALFGFNGWEFSLAMRYLRTRRKDGGIAVIAIISFAGIAAAVFALIATMSIMNGFRDELMSRVLAFNGHAYVTGQPLQDFAHRNDLLKRLRGVPGVLSAEPFLDSPGLIQTSVGRSGLAYMRGVLPEAIRNTAIIRDNIKGSLDSFGNGEYGGDVILIGDGLAKDLGVLPGDQVTLISPGGSTAFGAAPRRKTYEIGGIFRSGVSDLDKAFIYMPLEQAQLFFDREDEWDAVELKIDKPYEIAKFREPITKAAGSGALYSDWAEMNSSLWGALQIERNAMRIILSMVVFIATLNIISGVVMLVKNKTRDVAILRTMGASQASVARIFFLTGTTIGAAGTLTGLLLGVLFCTFIRQIQDFLEWLFRAHLFDPKIYYLDHVPAKMELSEVAFVAIASLLMACLSTLLPSLWAARLEPVEALRYE